MDFSTAPAAHPHAAMGTGASQPRARVQHLASTHPNRAPASDDVGGSPAPSWGSAPYHSGGVRSGSPRQGSGAAGGGLRDDGMDTIQPPLPSYVGHPLLSHLGTPLQPLYWLPWQEVFTSCAVVPPTAGKTGDKSRRTPRPLPWDKRAALPLPMLACVLVAIASGVLSAVKCIVRARRDVRPRGAHASHRQPPGDGGRASNAPS